MKKIVLYGSISLAVVALLILILWQSIAATLGWYVLTFTTDNPALTLTPAAQTITTSTSTAADAIAFGQTNVPILANSTPELRNSSSTLVVTFSDRNAAYYIANMTPFAAEFAANPAFSQEYKQIICTNLEWTANPCESNQTFVTALLSVNPDNISLFNKRDTKITHAIFTSLKNLYIAADTVRITSISTDHYTGYMTYSPTISLAFIFDDAGNEYELSFLSMSEPEVLEILGGMTPVATQ